MNSGQCERGIGRPSRSALTVKASKTPAVPNRTSGIERGGSSCVAMRAAIGVTPAINVTMSNSRYTRHMGGHGTGLDAL